MRSAAAFSDSMSFTTRVAAELKRKLRWIVESDVSRELDCRSLVDAGRLICRALEEHPGNDPVAVVGSERSVLAQPGEITAVSFERRIGCRQTSV